MEHIIYNKLKERFDFCFNEVKGDIGALITENIVLKAAFDEMKFQTEELSTENIKLQKELKSLKKHSCECTSKIKKPGNEKSEVTNLFAEFLEQDVKETDKILVPDTCPMDYSTDQKFHLLPKVVHPDLSKITEKEEYDSQMTQLESENSENDLDKTDVDLDESKDFLNSEKIMKYEEEHEENMNNDVIIIDDDDELTTNNNNLTPEDDAFTKKREETYKKIHDIFYDNNNENKPKCYGPTVRKKKERQLLQGFDCIQCKEYYKAAGLTESQMADRLQRCSKHRGTCAKPPTPPGYWDLGIPKNSFPVKKPQNEDTTNENKPRCLKRRNLQLPDRVWKS